MNAGEGKKYRGWTPREPITALSPDEVWAKVAANLDLVGHFAKRFLDRGLPMEDLIQEGAFGLRRAIELYDPEKGAALSTYAGYWIKQAIVSALANQVHTIRAPRAKRKSAKNLKLQAVAHSTGSLDASIHNDSFGADLTARPDRIDRGLLDDGLAALDQLDPRKRKIVVEHLGLGDDPPRYLADIAVEMGLTRARIHKLYRIAVAEMQRYVA